MDQSSSTHPPSPLIVQGFVVIGWTEKPYKVVRRVSVAVMLIDPQDTYRSVVAALLFEGLTVLGDVAADILLQQLLFRLWLLH